MLNYFYLNKIVKADIKILLEHLWNFFWGTLQFIIEMINIDYGQGQGTYDCFFLMLHAYKDMRVDTEAVVNDFVVMTSSSAFIWNILL